MHDGDLRVGLTATAGFCCWYLAKARLKNGASNVEPAPVSVIAGRPVPVPVTAAGVAESGVPVVVLVHAAR